MSYYSECTSVAQFFAGYFVEPFYDGSFHGTNGRTVSSDFNRLADYNISWTQVHGDVKDVVKRNLFVPYPHWPQLYECCKLVIKSHTELDTPFCGKPTQARIMSEVMALLRAKHGHNAPRWWLPVINKLRGKPPAQHQR